VGPGASPTKTTHLIYSATNNGGQGEAPATKSTALSQRFHTYTEGREPPLLGTRGDDQGKKRIEIRAAKAKPQTTELYFSTKCSKIAQKEQQAASQTNGSWFPILAGDGGKQKMGGGLRAGAK
jgi:hypothetical protein